MLATLRYLVAHRGEGRTLSLLTDQAAGPEDKPYWTDFLNQDTSFYTSYSGANRPREGRGSPAGILAMRADVIWGAQEPDPKAEGRAPRRVES